MSKEGMSADSFDLSDLDTIDESKMTVVANGKLTNWVWTFAGPGHQKSIDQSERLSRERLHRETQQEQARVNGRKWKAPDESVDEIRERNVRLVVERLLGWSPVTMGGQDYPFTADNAVKLLMDPRKPSLLVQALEFLGDEQAFAKRSVTG
ncbi:MAG: branched-chain amino acid ABC transporter [Mesorhizobium sp.]